jgi:hypothetical protein
LRKPQNAPRFLPARLISTAWVAQGAAGEDDRFRYDVDPKDPRDRQTFPEPCAAVLQLIGRAGLLPSP